MVPGRSREGRDLLTEPLVRELLGARLIAKLGTLNADGSVHLVPLWFLWREPSVLLPTHHATRKIRNLERDPRATLLIDDSRGGFDLRGVTLVGEATVERGPDVAATNREIHLRYLTAEGRALPEVESYLATDDVTIDFIPARMTSFNLRDTPQSEAVRRAGASRDLG